MPGSLQPHRRADTGAQDPWYWFVVPLSVDHGGDRGKIAGHNLSAGWVGCQNEEVGEVACEICRQAGVTRGGDGLRRVLPREPSRRYIVLTECYGKLRLDASAKCHEIALRSRTVLICQVRQRLVQE